MSETQSLTLLAEILDELRQIKEHLAFPQRVILGANNAIDPYEVLDRLGDGRASGAGNYT